MRSLGKRTVLLVDEAAGQVVDLHAVVDVEDRPPGWRRS
jgi:hypothetical protein